MVFRGLPYRKYFFWRLPQRKCFQELLATLKMVFRGLPHGKWFLKAYNTENCFQRIATRKMVFRELPHTKQFLSACHKENGFQWLASCHTENDFQEFATQNFLGACHTRKMVFMRFQRLAVDTIQCYDNNRHKIILKRKCKYH